MALNTTMLAALAPSGVSSDQVEASIVAARFHDLGKAHPAFQEMLRAAATTDEHRQSCPTSEVLLAKSAGSGRSGYKPRRRHFRHELASALALIGDWASLIEDYGESDLIAYLVAAHHGRVRMSIRSLPDETDGQILGIYEHDELPAVAIASTSGLSAATLSLRSAQLGCSDDGEPSWASRTTRLRDRADVGPFRLGYLEAVVRIADWRGSRTPGAGTAVGATSPDPTTEAAR